MFTFDFNIDMVRDFLPRKANPDEWFVHLKEVLPQYGINTPERVAGFMAQCYQESQGFTTTEENMNYSAKRLNEVFPKYFMHYGRDANQYAYNKEAIANIVYANRLGNGSISSGDGWRYKGAGIKQLTGKYNHSQFAEHMGLPVEKVGPLLVNDKRISVIGAAWFWKTNGLNEVADTKDIRRMTKIVNGGYNGLNDRIEAYERAKLIFGVEEKEYQSIRVLKNGSVGDDVRKLQHSLDLTPDGIFGPLTEEAVKDFQRANGLIPDGMVGPNTYKKING